jgi:hypothetical protein
MKKLPSSMLFAVITMLWSVPANALDPSASRICIKNSGSFLVSAATTCQVGNNKFTAGGTGNFPVGQTRCIDLTPYFNQGKLVKGMSCWAVANIEWGKQNHESGDNYTFDNNSSNTVNYEISGGTFSPSWLL